MSDGELKGIKLAACQTCSKCMGKGCDLCHPKYVQTRAEPSLRRLDEQELYDQALMILGRLDAQTTGYIKWLMRTYGAPQGEVKPFLCKCSKEHAMSLKKLNADFWQCPTCGGLIQ